ncbi:kinase-like domain-containing protein [Trichophaea hybrida]|nr:kinase-like domain-containing protein [Trichophaea hybrida]
MPTILNNKVIDPLKKLGKGKDGTVYKAELDGLAVAVKCFFDEQSRDKEHDKHILIAKILNDSLKNLEELRRYPQTQAFNAEAQALHERILIGKHSISRVLEARILYSVDGHTEYPCIVFRLEGQTMEKQLTSDNPPSVIEVLESARQLLAALSDIHHTGFHHNDLNTKNILQRFEGGGYVIIDLGESEKSGSEIGKEDRRHSQYCPPDRNIDHRGSFDVASIGSIIVELFVWGVLGGDDAVKVLRGFRKEREDDQVKHQLGEKFPDRTERFYIDSERLSPSVEKWLGRLEKVFPEIVVVLRGMLLINPDKRLLAREAFILFDDAFQQIKGMQGGESLA